MTSPQNVSAYVHSDLILREDYKADSPILQEYLKKIIYSLNDKEEGTMPLFEITNGERWFADQTVAGNSASNLRSGFRKVIDFGPLTINGTNTQPHGITTNPQTIFTQIRAVATDHTGNVFVESIPLPWIDPTGSANWITVEVDNTNVIITTSQDYSRFSIVYVVLDYLQYSLKPPFDE